MRRMRTGAPGTLPWRSPVMAAAGGMLLLAAVANGYGQPPGLVGVFDTLAVLDRSFRWVEWWGWPVLDAAVVVLLAAGLVDLAVSGLLRRREVGRKAAAVASRLAWYGVLVAVLSIGARTAALTSLDGGGDRLPPGLLGWLCALAVMAVVAGTEPRLFEGVKAGQGGRLARRLAVDPAAAAVSGFGILIAGALGVGFVRAAACRLAVSLVEIVRGTPSAHAERGDL